MTTVTDTNTPTINDISRAWNVWSDLERERGQNGRVHVHDEEVWAGKTTDLVNHQITALVVVVIGNHKTLWYTHTSSIYGNILSHKL